MKSIKLFITILGILALTSGCSVFMAANQPDKKDVHVLDAGTPRNVVIAELGTPAYTKEVEGKTCDVFSFVQGYSTGAKVGRSVFHGVADVLTFGLWEVVGTPIEVVADGNESKVEVFYDEKECVEKVNVIKGADVIKGVTSVGDTPKANQPSNASKD